MRSNNSKSGCSKASVPGVSDRAVYHITEKDPQGGPDRFVLLWSHTDDLGYFGSDDEIEASIRKQIDEHMKME